ncbi:hypothetical protein D9757_007042 [Collybiopsis confluens]|uniref:Peptidase A1 domain-containing protein n=1 Tax=Collybiopsis confluens TaxID=2823264 RepID=A0A8H5HBY1_9AGAR|nr:hypothetical protein D9757_007042 [Collybiopsis confluens]
MSRVIIDSISISPQLASGIKNLEDIVQSDFQRARKYLSPFALGHGPRAAIEARTKNPHHSGSSSQPSPSGTGRAITVNDARSSNTWTGANNVFKADATCQSTRKPVTVDYGSGSFTGTEYTGTFILGGQASGLRIENQSFAVAKEAQGFDGVDGILGIGPVDLTSSTVAGESSVPTVTDNAYKQGLISTEMIGISYQPSQAEGGGNMANGSLMFGSVDKTKITSEVTWVPITTQSPASKYWGIDQKITYGSSTESILELTAGIVDTGTTLIMIAEDAFLKYKALIGAEMDEKTSLLKLSADKVKNLQSMYFHVGGTTFELTANGQIWPRALNAALGGDADACYLVFASTGQNSGSGLDFINGFTFLQRFYSCYDVSGARVGLATTPWTEAETN